MIKLYLDTSFLNRPFDDPLIGSNKLEGEVLFVIINLVLKQKAILVNSALITYETSLNPFPERQLFIQKVLGLAKEFQDLNPEINQRAKKLREVVNIKPIDALHLASAEIAGVDFFITCDYDLIKKYQGNVRAETPLQFIEYIYESYQQTTTSN